MIKFINRLLRFLGIRAAFFRKDSPKQRRIDKHRQLAKELGMPFRGVR